MTLALKEAQKAELKNEVPIGAIIVDKKGTVIARAHNLKEQKLDTTAHAEILAIKKASKKVANWRLEGCSLYVTLEPCPMCLAAMREARIERLIFGAYDLKGGALSLGHNLHQDRRLNHQFSVVGGIQASENGQILSNFFRKKRKRENN